VAEFAEENLGLGSESVCAVHVAGGQSCAGLLEEAADVGHGLLFLVIEGAVDVVQTALGCGDGAFRLTAEICLVAGGELADGAYTGSSVRGLLRVPGGGLVALLDRRPGAACGAATTGGASG
jgi:hypothetical protein